VRFSLHATCSASVDQDQRGAVSGATVLYRDLELRTLQLCAPLQDGLAFNVATAVSGVDHDCDESAGADQFASLIECAQGAFALGDDAFVSPREVAQVKHDNFYLVVVLAWYEILEMCVAGQEQLYGGWRRGLFKSPSCRCQGCLLNVESENNALLADLSGEEERVMTIANRSVNCAVTRVEPLLDMLMTEFGEGFARHRLGSSCI